MEDKKECALLIYYQKKLEYNWFDKETYQAATMSEWFQLRSMFAGGCGDHQVWQWNETNATPWNRVNKSVESRKFTHIPHRNPENGRCSFHTRKLIFSVIICYSHFLWLRDKLLKHHKIDHSILVDTKNSVDDNIITLSEPLSLQSHRDTHS